jgi:hypothetical protein
MSHHEPRALRLAVDLEAEALMSAFGHEAYAVACQRAEEASSDALAMDWRGVASRIARRSARRFSGSWPF